MKKNVLSIGLIIILSVMLIVLTGCGEDSSPKTYSEMVNVVRNATTSTGPTIGEAFDYGLENSEWSDKTLSVYSTEVKVTGKDKESGDTIEMIWEVTSPGGDDHNYQLEEYTRNGESKDVFSASAVLRGYASKVKEQQNN